MPLLQGTSPKTDLLLQWNFFVKPPAKNSQNRDIVFSRELWTIVVLARIKQKSQFLLLGRCNTQDNKAQSKIHDVDLRLENRSLVQWGDDIFKHLESLQFVWRIVGIQLFWPLLTWYRPIKSHFVLLVFASNVSLSCLKESLWILNLMLHRITNDFLVFIGCLNYTKALLKLDI